MIRFPNEISQWDIGRLSWNAVEGTPLPPHDILAERHFAFSP
jgi:hypothetical protein